MTKSDIVTGLVTDLADEAASLMGILDPISAEQWALATPAPGWTIHDQVAHLANFDALTAMAIASPAEFAVFRDNLPDLQEYVDEVGPAHAWQTGAQKLRWWRAENDALRSAAIKADPAVRVPWFGPAMSLPSKITARIMETWAHGQDVADTLGVVREPTQRLRHVARIGVLAFANSFRARGRMIPDARVFVELSAPAGDGGWRWGDEDAPNVVRGDALDFCLVVTQRRHLTDTTLEVRGSVAQEWMSIAQAFAGPPGRGRRPGEFAASSSPHSHAG